MPPLAVKQRGLKPPKLTLAQQRQTKLLKVKSLLV